MARPLPVPAPTTLNVQIDPHQNPRAYAQVVAEIFYAEQAALQMFERLDDPAVVIQSEMFRGAKKMLVQDEKKHMVDLEQIASWLGFPKMPPASPESVTFWGDLRGFYAKGSPWVPAKASTMALFVLTSEGLGYAFLHHLVAATIEGPIRERLADNLRDEQRHLRVSMSLLERVVGTDPLLRFDIMTYLKAFMFRARHPGRVQLRLAQELGLDYFAISSSMILFLRRLIVDSLQNGAGSVHPSALQIGDWVAEIACSPSAMRLARPLMLLPDPPLYPLVMQRWAMLDRWLRENAWKWTR
jgi:hypothetical protein